MDAGNHVPSAFEIITSYLRENGFDGLCNAEGDCGCSLDNFAAYCSGIIDKHCKPAYRHDLPCEGCDRECEPIHDTEKFCGEKPAWRR